MAYTWDRANTPDDLAAALDTLATHYPGLNAHAGDGAPLRFIHTPGATGPHIARASHIATLHYGTLTHALRGIGTLLSDLVPEGGSHTESLPFDRFGVMIDCSRNAVMKPDHVKQWMRQLALLGYNQLMLYTEETYALPDEPYFGYLRGGYTLEDLQELDNYAATLGIELVGCIQTLGHLEHLLKWSPYWLIKDTPSVLMVDDDRTYDLIEKMIACYARAYRTRRIHIGMDETHDLGRGRFMDLFGHERGYDLFQRHLHRVLAICEKHGLHPMIWSDMYFRMGNPAQSYYDPATRIPDDVKQAVPSAVELVYWDYYHEDQTFYEDWIARHRDLGHEPVMASGLWTWGGHFWYAHHQTLRTVPPCIRACRQAGVKQLFFTLWGDDGAYCEYDTALAGLVYAADFAAQQDHPDEAACGKRMTAIVGAGYATVLQAAEWQEAFQPASLFWDDPLLGIYWKNERLKGPAHWPAIQRILQRSLTRLKPLCDDSRPIDFAHWHAVTTYLREVIRLRLELDDAYAQRDTARLIKVERMARRLIRLLDRCHDTFRRQWLRRNRPQGFETIQHRIGARKMRWQELVVRLQELREGSVDQIPELDEQPTAPATLYTRWRDVAGSGIL